jgi:biopolymer transport protein ExbD
MARIKIGLVIIVVTILLPLGTDQWVKTRRFQPLDIPVSLDVGKIHTAQFETNLRGSYNVYFGVHYGPNYVLTERECPASPSRDVHWRLYRLSGGTPGKKELWPSGVSPRSGELDEFQGPSGKYELEWEIGPDAACLNALHPGLTIISTSSEGYEQIDGVIQYLPFFFGGAGIILVLRGLGVLLWGRLVGPRTLRMLPELTIRNVLPLRPFDRGGPMAPMTHLSNFIMAWVCVLGVVLFFHMSITPPTSNGLFVKIQERGTTLRQKSPWPQTMSVYVGADNQFYVNSKPVSPERLRAKLREELGKQMVWTVYLEANENATFAKALYAMDAIQAVGAKVAWITPQIRGELNRQTPQPRSDAFPQKIDGRR